MINLKNLKNEIQKNKEQFKKFLPITKEDVDYFRQGLEELSAKDIFIVLDLFN